VLSQINDHKLALEKVDECYKFFHVIFKSLIDTMEVMAKVGLNNLKNFEF